MHFFNLEMLQAGPQRPRKLQKSILMEFRDLTTRLLILEPILKQFWGLALAPPLLPSVAPDGTPEANLPRKLAFGIKVFKCFQRP
jgi:hypothetical protein